MRSIRGESHPFPHEEFRDGGRTAARRGQDLEQIKRLSLLEYLQGHHGPLRRVGAGPEWVGLCPLHRETRPSFYVNAAKNLFYCHGCGRGGDLIRFLQLSQGLSFADSVAHLSREPAPPQTELLEQAARFYQQQLPARPEARQYLERRGLRDPGLIRELGLGYAPGANLRAHLTARGYSFEQLLRAGLINRRGQDAFYRRMIFPCRQDGRIVNLYGRSIGADFPHRLLPGPRGGLFAWESVGADSSVILVEGLFDLAVLWQAGFRNTTCALGTHLTSLQWAQLCDRPDRRVYLVFDQDDNGAGPQAAAALARRLQTAGLGVRLVQLPPPLDPNSWFAAGATAADFTARLKEARQP
jgi:DNA primase